MYKKPIILHAELFEGVYAESGYEEVVNDIPAAADEVESDSYTLTQTNAWDGNKQYDISLYNNSDQRVGAIVAVVKVIGTVTSIGGNVTGIVQGDSARIIFNNYGNMIEPHTQYGPVYMAVTGEGEFGLE